MAKKISVFAFVVIVSFFTFIFWRNGDLKNSSELVSRGMTQADVVELLGVPDKERAHCRDGPTWLGEPQHGKVCAVEFQYNAFLMPKFWTVGFDASGKVIAKYNYVSP